MRVVTETLLEMHYFRALLNEVASVAGKRLLRVLKPSIKSEKWLAFDEGFVVSELAEEELLARLKEEIKGQGDVNQLLHVGYFLQFKVVSRLVGANAARPAGIQLPFYRVKIDMGKASDVARSQHENLVWLASNQRVDVSYACPMVFHTDDILREPCLDDLRLVDVQSAPAGWSRGEQHFICFQAPSDPTPVWLSQPIPARSWSAHAWAERALAQNQLGTAAAVEQLVGLVRMHGDAVAQVDDVGQAAYRADVRRALCIVTLADPVPT